MVKGWAEKIKAAQSIRTIEKGGKELPRVKFGEEAEDWGWDKPCHDCDVVKGQFHVPGCDVERCPACGGQAIFCDCDDDEEAAS